MGLGLFRLTCAGTAVAALSLFMQAAQAASEFHPSAMDLIQLPPYCQGQFRPELTKDPAYRMPDCGSRFNHYCPALVLLNQAGQASRSKAERQHNLGQARKHLEYTIDSMTPTCPLAPLVRAAETRRKMLEKTLR